MKVAVIGAGPAGLAAAWELKTLGVSVDIFEGHSKPGGCASYFRRPLVQGTTSLGHPDQNGGSPVPKALFDSGATVLWSMREGEFYNSLLKKWGLEVPSFATHPFHRFHIGNSFIELDARNEETWTRSLLQNFPQDKTFIEQSFPKFFKIAKTLNALLYKIPAEPFLSLSSLAENIKLLPEISTIIPDLVCLPRNFAKLIETCSPEFKAWADSLLLISLQAKATEVESLYGIAALCFYPLGCGSLQGGMARLFDLLAKNFPSEKTRLFFKENVLSVSYDKGYTLQTNNALHSGYSHILLSTPRWNSTELFKEKLFANPQKLEWDEIKDHLWTAVVNYLVFKDSDSLPDAAFNHLVKNEKGDFYFSISARGDLLRAPAKYRVVTASTHEKLGNWNYLAYIKKKDFPGRELYEAHKKRWEKSFHEAAANVFTEAPVFSEIGSPKTFSAYTQRREGFVGGIPLTRDFSFLKSPTQETLLPNVFQIGDTSFPGQSVVNSAVGALEAVRKILTSV